jgi:hypothetical protein
MFKHTLIFSPGNWYGEGRILLNMVEEELIFNTRWAFQIPDFSGQIIGTQDIQIQGLSESMRNELTFSNFQNKGFSVAMENQNIGRIVGIGICDETMIGWEFRNPDLNFEGFETYTLQPDGSYLMKGEYVTSDQFRTQIEARIWVKPASMPPSTDFLKENESGPENEEEEP